MQRSLTAVLRVLPLSLVYGLDVLSIPFYILFRRKGRHASYRFYRRRMGYGPFKSWRYMWRNHFRMGQAVIDRFAAFAGKSFRLVRENQAPFDALLDRPEGFVMLSAHTGLYELAGYHLQTGAKRLYALVYPHETEDVMQGRRQQFARTGIQMVPVQQDLAHLYTLSGALAEGHIVSLPADRVFGSPKTLTCNFFGAPAPFPKGPFVLATSRQAQAVAVFVMKEGIRTYRLIYKMLPLSEPAALAQAYADALEETVRRYPDQWFNFYDFWHAD